MTPINHINQSINFSLWNGTPSNKRILPAGSNESEPKRISNHQYLYAQPDQSRPGMKLDTDILVDMMSSTPPVPKDIAKVLECSEQLCLDKYRGKRWTSEETKKLVGMMLSTPPVDSKVIAAELGRSAQSCINRYQYYLFTSQLRDAVVAADPGSKLDNKEIFRRANIPLDQVEREELISMYQKGYLLKDCALLLRRSYVVIMKTAKELNLTLQNRNQWKGTALHPINGAPSSEPAPKPVSEVQAAPSDSLVINLYCMDESGNISSDPYEDFFDEGKLYGKD